jgi:glutamate synthase (NADPH/NADH) small chain
MECDTFVVAIGNSPTPLIPMTTQGIKTNKWGGIVVDENGMTSKDRVYAAGDIVTGAATVIEAAGAGKAVAAAIHKRLSGGK